MKNVAKASKKATKNETAEREEPTAEATNALARAALGWERTLEADEGILWGIFEAIREVRHRVDCGTGTALTDDEGTSEIAFANRREAHIQLTFIEQMLDQAVTMRRIEPKVVAS